MVVHGELNVFRPLDIEAILNKSLRALKAGGHLLAEVLTLAAVRALGEGGSSWYSSPGGLFSHPPHLCLNEDFWGVDKRVSTERYYILDIGSGNVRHYAACIQGYSGDGYLSLFDIAGYKNVTIYPSLMGIPPEDDSPYIVISVKNFRRSNTWCSR